MRTLSKALAATGLLGIGGAAAADFSANVALTSDYRFRGVSQSARDPAAQGGVDYARDGLYLGVWGSTIDFDAGPGSDPDADLEVDVYGGYAWAAAGVEWDAGILHYAYPGSESGADLPFTEVYLGGAYGPASVTYYYTDDYTGPTRESAYYLTAGVDFELGAGLALGLSAGRSGGDGIDATFGDSYTDYRIGVSRDFAGVGFDLSYVDTSGISPDVTADTFNTEGTVVLTVSKTF